ncbi:GntR family transcriptional regulator [Acetobacteraceae bacterium H6797]|nr:GntR family transcriptional regulator [Acetobacteraceae bacterium H6797]
MSRKSANVLKLAAPGVPPRYQQIRDILRDRIRLGRYPVGSHLPTEAALCIEFEVSRYTLREALRRLVEEGLLSRRQKSGTMVLTASPPSVFVHTIRQVSDLYQMAVDTHSEILSVRDDEPTPPPRPDLGRDAEGDWLRLDSLRSDIASRRPIAYIVSYMPARFGWLVPELYAVRGPLYAHLESRSGEKIERVVQEVTAGTLPPRAARALGEAPHAVGVCMHRRYLTRQGMLIMSYSWHPAASFLYRTEFSRSGEAEEETAA